MSFNPSNTIAIFTYNILCNQYIRHGDYQGIDQEMLDWSGRKKRIQKKLKKSGADLICLQELDKEAFSYFSSELSDYQGFHLFSRDASLEGVGTFVKKGAFDWIEHQEESPISKPALLTSVWRGEDRIVLLNVKMKWTKQDDPRDQVADEFAQLEKAIPEQRGILVGDFNREPDHFLIKKLCFKRFQDVFLPKPFPTYYSQRVGKRIDYIFATQDLRAAPGWPPIAHGLIPNEEEPSDHLPLFAALSWDRLG
jgi:mRNA deadenylase 3'-5' endonuclease subunit Ccr4